MSSYKYHSALQREHFSKEETQYTFDGNSALYHDISNNLPTQFNKCDVLYSEIAWSSGHKKFNNRAESNTSYLNYISGIYRLIMTNQKPILIIGGKKDLRLLPQNYNQIIDTKINGGVAYLAVYNFVYAGPTDNNFEVVKFLAKAFNCVGDFCCGYGNTSKIFYEAGKNFVVSDYNKKCIGYIKQHYENLLK